MFFDDLLKIEEIGMRTGCAVFVIPDREEIKIKNAIILKPEEKVSITIEQVRGTIAELTTKQSEDRFVLIRPAEKMTEEAANAILKNLEEPRDKIHFVLITSGASQLLPTILSRAEIYIWKNGRKSLGEISADVKTKEIAKRLLVAKPVELAQLAEDLTKKKEGIRNHVLEVLAVTIEMAYKSYFLTNKKVFLNKIPKLITAYDNISRNGHVKLHLVADLI